MKCFASELNLKDDPELIALYKEHHRNVWPEVLEGIRDSGITRMKIFLKGRHMFMYCETHDDFSPRNSSKNPIQVRKNDEWQELMHKFQEQLPGSPRGEWWGPMEEVFDLETA